MQIQEIFINSFGLYNNQIIGDLAPGLNIFAGDNESGKSTALEFLRTVMFGRATGSGSRTGQTYAGAKGGSIIFSLSSSWGAGANVGGGVGGGVGVGASMGTGAGKDYKLFWNPSKSMAAAFTLHELPKTDKEEPKELDYSFFTEFSGAITREFFSSIYGFSLEQLQEAGSLKDGRVNDILYGAGFGLGSVSLPSVLDCLKKSCMERLFKPLGSAYPINEKILALQELEEELKKTRERLPTCNALQENLETLAKELKQVEKEHEFTTYALHELTAWPALRLALLELETLQTDLANQAPPFANFDGLFEDADLTKTQELERERIKLTEQIAECQKESRNIEHELAEPDSTAEAKQNLAADIDNILQGEILYYDQKGTFSRLADQYKDLAGDFNLYFHPNLSPHSPPDLQNEQNLTAALPELEPAFIATLDDSLSGLKLLFAEYEKNSEAGSPAKNGKALSRYKLPVAAALLSALLGILSVLNGYSLPSTILLALCPVLVFAIISLLKPYSEAKSKQAAAQQANIRSEPFLHVLSPLLKRNGHSTPLSLADISQQNLSEASNHIEKWEKAASMQQSMEEQEQKLQDFEVRCAMLYGMLNEEGKASSTEEILEKFKQFKNHSHSAALQREKSKGRLEGLQGQINGLANGLKACQNHLEKVFAKAEVSNFGELTVLLDLWKKRKNILEQTRSKQAAVNKAPFSVNYLSQIAGVSFLFKTLQKATNNPQNEAFHSAFLAISTEDMDKARHLLAEGQRQLSTHRDNIHKQQGTLQGELAQLLDKGDIDELTRKKNIQKEELRRLAHKWTVDALAHTFIQTAKTSFEQNNQSAVMAKASQLFSLITNGAYSGLNPSAEKGSFNVISNTGREWKPIELSRGTREQLYLALRLALIENRSVKEEPLPLIIDDAFVNFDPTRLQSAIKTLLSLASSHQILYFTCQPHVEKSIASVAKLLNLPYRLYNLRAGVITEDEN